MPNVESNKNKFAIHGHVFMIMCEKWPDGAVVVPKHPLHNFLIAKLSMKIERAVRFMCFS